MRTDRKTSGLKKLAWVYEWALGIAVLLLIVVASAGVSP